MKILDSYRGNLVGKYEIQVLINNQVIWSDDIEGDEKWRRLNLPLNQYIDPSTQTEFNLAVRLVALTDVDYDDVLELRVAVDDIHVFGGMVNNGSMEAGSGWSYSETNGRWTGRYSYIDKFSGHRAFMLMHPYKQNAVGNTYAQIAQRVALKHPLDVFSISFDGQGAYAHKDGGPYHLDVREPNDLTPQIAPGNRLGDRSVLLGASYPSIAMNGQVPPLADSGYLEFRVRPAQQNQGGNLLSFIEYRQADNTHVAVQMTPQRHIRVSRADNTAHQFDLRTTSTLPLLVSTHVLVQQDGTGIKIYFDGQLQQTTQATDEQHWLHNLSTYRFDIGDSRDGSYEGQLAHIKLSGRILSDSEILTRAQRGFADTQFEFEAPLTQDTESSVTGNGIECQRPNAGFTLTEGVTPGTFAANFNATHHVLAEARHQCRKQS